jgi:hypothetical protein
MAIAAATAADAPAPATTAPAGTAAATAAPVEKPTAPKADAKADAKAEESKLTEEEKWIFEPQSGRLDPFYDLRTRMKLELEIPREGPTDGTPWTPTGPIKNRSDWAKVEMQKVEAAIVAKKWDDAIKTCDNAIKALSKDAGNDEAQQLIEKFKRYRTQADEAKTYEEAQAKFDALDLRIEGILWSPEGSLAVVNGEPRARGVNERVKDCVIINIDTNRVDFLFHYNRRRFEFQRYVGEEAKSSAKKDAR